MSIYAKTKEHCNMVWKEVDNNHQWSNGEYDNAYDYCAYGEYERDAYDSWYEEYVKVNEKRPALEDIKKAIHDIAMIRDSYLEWNDKDIIEAVSD